MKTDFEVATGIWKEVMRPISLPIWVERKTEPFRQNNYIRMRLEAEISHGFAF
jgi:hypothetical protein